MSTDEGVSTVRIEGAAAIVTGGSSGIGLATARLLAARGARVGLIARDEGRLAEAAKIVGEAGGRSAVWTHACDVSDEAAVRSAVERFAAEVGEPDLLVNSAGVFIPGYFESMPSELFREHLDIDVLGVIYATRAVVPYMIARKRGHIVNVSSMAGFMGIFGYTAYSTAKFAVMGFSESLRSEMKPLGIGVTVVCPPDVDTPGLVKEKSLRPPETDKVCGNVAAIPAEQVAAELVRGVERGKYLVIPGAIGKLYHFLKGVWPGLFFIVTDGDVAKARAARSAKSGASSPARESE